MRAQIQVVQTHVEEADEKTVHYFTISEQSHWPIHTLVVEAIEEVAGRSAEEIDPLSNSVDPEALDRLFQPRSNGEPRKGGKITFSVDEFRVTVTSRGNIMIVEDD